MKQIQKTKMTISAARVREGVQELGLDLEKTKVALAPMTNDEVSGFSTVAMAALSAAYIRAIADLTTRYALAFEQFSDGGELIELELPVVDEALSLGDIESGVIAKFQHADRADLYARVRGSAAIKFWDENIVGSFTKPAGETDAYWRGFFRQLIEG